MLKPYKWDNKKPTAQMLGRWQPFHDGHYTLLYCFIAGVVIVVFNLFAGSVLGNIGAG